MLKVERYKLPEWEPLDPKQAAEIRDAFMADEEALKKDLEEAARLQRLSEWYTMTHY